jgi:hypothetical protein
MCILHPQTGPATGQGHKTSWLVCAAVIRTHRPRHRQRQHRSQRKNNLARVWGHLGPSSFGSRKLGSSHSCSAFVGPCHSRLWELRFKQLWLDSNHCGPLHVAASHFVLGGIYSPWGAGVGLRDQQGTFVTSGHLGPYTLKHNKFKKGPPPGKGHKTFWLV